MIERQLAHAQVPQYVDVSLPFFDKGLLAIHAELDVAGIKDARTGISCVLDAVADLGDLLACSKDSLDEEAIRGLGWSIHFMSRFAQSVSDALPSPSEQRS